MNPISVWYHCRLFGGEPEINPDFSLPLMGEQMETMKDSGLLSACQELVVCVNGDGANKAAARGLAPKARFVDNGSQAKSLLPTVNALREWSIQHPDWLVCFWHIKGVTHPKDYLNTVWRHCMEKWVIKHWRQCVADILAGHDTVGAHWLTREQYGDIVTYPFWGGQFFWAKASFLAELPALPSEPKTRSDWFLSENWIGMGRKPKIKDYAPHWPGIQPCGSNL